MTWHQLNLEVADSAAAVRLLVDELGPALTAAQAAGQLDTWWYLRKSPLKLRYRADSDTRVITDLLTALVDRGDATSWCTTIYEPETVAFGGDAAMAIAHQLFHADSINVLAYARGGAGLGQRETTVLLASALMRGAGLDWYEQGDVWHRLERERRAVPDALPDDPAHLARLRDAVGQLMIAPAQRLCDPGKPLHGFDGWFSAFETAGRHLAHLARLGVLERGLRAVLAHHLIFHANRAGLSLTDQATIARLALNTVFADGEPDPIQKGSAP